MSSQCINTIKCLHFSGTGSERLQVQMMEGEDKDGHRDSTAARAQYTDAYIIPSKLGRWMVQL